MPSRIKRPLPKPKTNKSGVLNYTFSDGPVCLFCAMMIKRTGKSHRLETTSYKDGVVSNSFMMVDCPDAK